jgi:hypothetical protein
LHMNNGCWDLQHHFRTAASFHCVRTAWRGVTRQDSIQGFELKSMGIESGRPRTRVRSMRTWWSWTRPCLRWSKKSLHMGSVTRHCFLSITTVLNSSYIFRPSWDSAESCGLIG